jgi:hypothetical protein
MARGKVQDQFYLLLAAIVFTLGTMSLIFFLDDHGVPDRLGFFILFNGAFFVFCITWFGVAFFRRTPNFWLFHVGWIIVHTCVCILWVRSAFWVELCVLTMPVETYCYFKISRRRLVRLLQSDSNAMTVSPTS